MRRADAHDVKLHPNFSGNIARTSGGLHANFSRIALKCRGIAFQLHLSCIELQSGKNVDERRAMGGLNIGKLGTPWVVARRCGFTFETMSSIRRANASAVGLPKS